MPESFQREKPPSRINLYLELLEGDAREKVELPFRLLMLGNYTNREDDTPVEDREAININADNFEAVMESMDLGVEYNVPNRLTEDEDGREIEVALEINNMKSFRPEAVIKQVPELNRMMAMRNLLQDLRNRVVSTKEFRKRLEEIVQDEEALGQLATELNQMVSEGQTPADQTTAAPKAKQ